MGRTAELPNLVDRDTWAYRRLIASIRVMAVPLPLPFCSLLQLMAGVGDGQFASPFCKAIHRKGWAVDLGAAESGSLSSFQRVRNSLYLAGKWKGQHPSQLKFLPWESFLGLVYRIRSSRWQFERLVSTERSPKYAGRQGRERKRMWDGRIHLPDQVSRLPVEEMLESSCKNL